MALCSLPGAPGGPRPGGSGARSLLHLRPPPPPGIGQRPGRCGAARRGGEGAAGLRRGGGAARPDLGAAELVRGGRGGGRDRAAPGPGSAAPRSALRPRRCPAAPAGGGRAAVRRRAGRAGGRSRAGRSGAGGALRRNSAPCRTDGITAPRRGGPAERPPAPTPRRRGPVRNGGRRAALPWRPAPPHPPSRSAPGISPFASAPRRRRGSVRDAEVGIRLCPRERRAAPALLCPVPSARCDLSLRPIPSHPSCPVVFSSTPPHPSYSHPIVSHSVSPPCPINSVLPH